MKARRTLDRRFLIKTALVVGAVVAVGALAAACSTAPIFYADETQFTDHERFMIQLAFDEWRTASGGRYSAEVVFVAPGIDGSHNVIQKVEYADPACLEHAASSTKETTPFGSRYVILMSDNQVVRDAAKRWNRTWEDSFRITLMHELGHYFGKQHTPDNGNIMSMSMNTTEHLTAEDVQ